MWYDQYTIETDWFSFPVFRILKHINTETSTSAAQILAGNPGTMPMAHVQPADKAITVKQYLSITELVLFLQLQQSHGADKTIE